ncbi:MAG: hypothetical protein ACK5SI_14915, partial [Planctomycetia bacterium]
FRERLGRGRGLLGGQARERLVLHALLGGLRPSPAAPARGRERHTGQHPCRGAGLRGGRSATDR